MEVLNCRAEARGLRLPGQDQARGARRRGLQNLAGQQDDRGLNDHHEHREKRQQHERNDRRSPGFAAQEALPPEAASETRRTGAYHVLGNMHRGEAHGIDPGSSAQCHKALTEWLVR